MHRKSNSIVSVTDSGIGNRLKSLLSVMRMTDSYYIYWPKNRSTGASFSDLFENDIEVNKIFLSNNLFYKNFDFFFARTHFSANLAVFKEDHLRPDFASSLYDAKKGKFSKINDGLSIDFAYERIPESIQTRYLRKIDVLTPVSYVRHEVDRFERDNFDQNTVGVQIRTWKDEARRQDMFCLSSLFREMDKLDGKNFFLTGDDQNVLDQVMLRYPGRTFSYKKRVLDFEPGSYDSKSVEFSQDGLIDLLLLGRASSIVGSHLSSFVECAWWFGKCKANVRIVEPKVG